MRILIENNGVKNGGIEVIFQTLANDLAKRGHAVTICAEVDNKIEFRPAFRAGVRCVRRFRWKDASSLPGRIQNYVCYRILNPLIDAFHSLLYFDVILSMNEGRVMRRVSRMWGKRKLAMVHSDFNGPIHWKNNCFASRTEELNCMKRFDSVICVSQTVKNSILQTLGDPQNLCICYNPINVERIRALALETCDVQKPAGKTLIVSIGRLAPIKQYDKLIRICEKLHASMDVELWIIGDGPKRDELEAQIKNGNLSFVRLMGEKTNPFPYLRQADLFCSSSMNESYGLAIQEALILGVPVVAVSCPGIVESLDRRFGMLVEDDADVLAEAIQAMLRPECLSAYRDAIAREYSVEALYEPRLEAIYSLMTPKSSNG